MEPALKIAIIQYDVKWHDIHGNLVLLEKLLGDLVTPVDFILLPEMFATGFTMTPGVFGRKDHNLVSSWMKRVSSTLKTAIAGSHPCSVGRNFFNRLILYLPDGKSYHYDKRHPFSFSGEDKVYKPGIERKLFEIGEWKIFPLICYDLRFPVWSRNTLNYDVLIYSANWPAVRNPAWELLLKARAVENQCYVAGANRIGTDNRGIQYSGNSQVISPAGEIIGKLQNKQDILYAEINKTELLNYRRSFPVLNDRDDFTIHL